MAFAHRTLFALALALAAACQGGAAPASDPAEGAPTEPAPPPASERFPGAYAFVVEAGEFSVEHGIVWDGAELARSVDGHEIGRSRCAIERDDRDVIGLACEEDYRVFRWRDGAWWDDISGVRLTRRADAPAAEGSGVLTEGEGSAPLPGG